MLDDAKNTLAEFQAISSNLTKAENLSKTNTVEINNDMNLNNLTAGKGDIIKNLTEQQDKNATSK